MDPGRTARWSTAAGALGLAANALLVAFYALEAGRVPPLPVSLGTLNDLTGAVGTATMIPVVLALGGRRVRRLGLAATGVLTIAGPLLVIGVLPFPVAALDETVRPTRSRSPWPRSSVGHNGDTPDVSLHVDGADQRLCGTSIRRATTCPSSRRAAPVG